MLKKQKTPQHKTVLVARLFVANKRKEKK